MEDTKSLFEAMKKPMLPLAQAFNRSRVIKRLAIGYTVIPVGTQAGSA